ncbi:FadR/GntR family transcriptional regulator [Rathayibacter sp. VKM Ac-2754]|uniref:FadR/GntR family transcriptional regulator n=1 Tax=Rathayibacter sp. VKM Ac-2754 TaxID=2609251 RepID=UPI001357E710|nr:FCD domain-containing protein [Rathayibacter sp. VKM Ac-2754]MWV60104.1 FCD domain-containing protein [Rathayibacter sp. VKM Ac-2754]
MRRLSGLAPVVRGGAGSSYSQLNDQLGSAICDGRLPEGTVMTVEEIEVATATSRSVVREVARGLASRGLLEPRRRIGLRVLPEAAWNLFDPQVIRWRLRSPQRESQLRTLGEMRLAVEPEAARLAASRRTLDEAADIVSAAARLWSAGSTVGADPDALLREDAALHGLVLRASGNPMFAQVSSVIQETLRERTLHELGRHGFDAHDLQLHVDLATHIQRGDAGGASEVMRAIIERTQ